MAQESRAKKECFCLVKLRMSGREKSAGHAMGEFRRGCSVSTNRRWKNSQCGMSRRQVIKASVQWRCSIESQPSATGGRKSWRQQLRNWNLSSLEGMRIPKQGSLQEFSKGKEIQTGWQECGAGREARTSPEKRSTLKFQKHGMVSSRSSGKDTVAWLQRNIDIFEVQEQELLPAKCCRWDQRFKPARQNAVHVKDISRRSGVETVRCGRLLRRRKKFCKMRAARGKQSW